nr:hypothetical protein [Thalassotalea crassostreae]
MRLSLKETKETKKYYPLGFKLLVDYLLTNNEVIIDYKVIADPKNQSDMPFSIGNHITFNAPFNKANTLNDFDFTIDSKYKLERNERRLINGNLVPSNLNGIHSITELPERKSISYTSLSESSMVTMYDTDGIQVSMSHHAISYPAKAFADFNLWASAEHGYFSPEPWVGAQNSLNSGYGLLRLTQGNAWNCQVKIQIKKLK